jgi:hypothetical protein
MHINTCKLFEKIDVFWLVKCVKFCVDSFEMNIHFYLE